MTTEKITILDTEDAKAELFTLEKYKQLTGIDVNFSENEYFVALLRDGSHVPFIFEQATAEPNIFIHTVLLVGSYEAVIAGEFYVKGGDKHIEEILPSRFAENISVNISYKVGTVKRTSSIGYDPRRTRPIGIKFRAKDLV